MSRRSPPPQFYLRKSNLQYNNTNSFCSRKLNRYGVTKTRKPWILSMITNVSALSTLISLVGPPSPTPIILRMNSTEVQLSNLQYNNTNYFFSLKLNRYGGHKTSKLWIIILYIITNFRPKVWTGSSFCSSNHSSLTNPSPVFFFSIQRLPTQRHRGSRCLYDEKNENLSVGQLPWGGHIGHVYH